MKSHNILTILFIIIVISIIGFAYYFIKNNNDVSDADNDNSTEFNIAVVENMKMGITDYDSMNPYLTNNREIINLDKLIFEPLINVTPDYHAQYCLAKVINIVDDTTYEVKVDTSIKWQNGTNLCAEDVRFSINRLKERNCVYSANVAKVASMEVPDNETCIIHLSSKVNFFEYNLSFPLMCSSYYEGEDFGSSVKIPIGTGMYKIGSIDENNVFLITNDRWRNINTSKPRTSTITVHKYGAIGEIYNAFKLGNIDIVSTSMTEYANYVGTMGYNTKQYVLRNYDFLSLNCYDGILSDLHVRRAISYAINKDTIVSTVYGYKRVVSNTPLDYGSFLSTNENLATANQEEAKRELIDGGWVYEGNRWTKDGKVLRITLSVSNTDQLRINTAYNIKSQLEQIGINVTVNVISYDRYSGFINNRNYQMLLTGVQDSINPDLSYFYGSGNLANYYNEEAQNNMGNLEKYTDIIKQANYDCPYIGLYRNKGTLILNSNMGGDFTSYNYNIYSNFDKWYRQQ